MNSNRTHKELSQSRRLDEVARILAIVVLRARFRAIDGENPHSQAENSPNSTVTCLEVPEETVLSVTSG